MLFPLEGVLWLGTSKWLPCCCYEWSHDLWHQCRQPYFMVCCILFLCYGVILWWQMNEIIRNSYWTRPYSVISDNLFDIWISEMWLFVVPPRSGIWTEHFCWVARGSRTLTRSFIKGSLLAKCISVLIKRCVHITPMLFGESALGLASWYIFAVTKIMTDLKFSLKLYTWYKSLWL